MSGHTPGPWAVAPYSSGCGDVKVTGPCSLPRPRLGPVASAFTNLAGPMDAECVAEMKANARLIAAAPSLYAEMVRFLPVLESAEADSELWARLTAGTGIATANAYRAALLSATGAAE